MDNTNDASVNQDQAVDECENAVFPITLRILGITRMFGEWVHNSIYRLTPRLDLRYNASMIKKILRRIRCFFLGHIYTCDAMEGIAATEEQLKDGLDGFFDYATMYCGHCGKVFKRGDKVIRS